MTRTSYKFRQLKGYRGYSIVKRTYTEQDTKTRRVTHQAHMYGILDTDNWMSSMDDARCGIRAAIAVEEFSNRVHSILADSQLDIHKKSNMIFNEWCLADCTIVREAHKAPTDGDWIKDHFRDETERIKIKSRHTIEHAERAYVLKGQRLAGREGK